MSSRATRRAFAEDDNRQEVVALSSIRHQGWVTITPLTPITEALRRCPDPDRVGFDGGLIIQSLSVRMSGKGQSGNP